MYPMSASMLRLFQSTRPVRGGTSNKAYLDGLNDISIHPPRAGRDELPQGLQGGRVISIHPPRAGRDLAKASIWRFSIISIHPPRAGRDID